MSASAGIDMDVDRAARHDETIITFRENSASGPTSRRANHRSEEFHRFANIH